MIHKTSHGYDLRSLCATHVVTLPYMSTYCMRTQTVHHHFPQSHLQIGLYVLCMFWKCSFSKQSLFSPFARTNIPKEVMSFPDFPFAKHLPSFVHHTEVRKYLEQYCDHFHLWDHIRVWFQHNLCQSFWVCQMCQASITFINQIVVSSICHLFVPFHIKSVLQAEFLAFLLHYLNVLKVSFVQSLCKLYVYLHFWNPFSSLARLWMQWTQ